MVESGENPAWLEVLMREKFFNACLVHEEAKKNEKNILCLDCCFSICPHCFTSHTSHRLLQIRRYVYHDVLRLEDASRLMDCSFIQSYITNSAKVVFINQRPPTRQFRGSGNICCTCERSLQSPYLFCSISCKIDDVMKRQGDLSGFLRDCKYLPLTENALDDGLMTPDSTLEPVGSARTSSGSGGYGGVVWCRTLACTAATTEIVRRKRSNSAATCRRITAASSTAPGAPASLLNRRKNTPPQRAPLY
ncbi:PREDICTED: uncharacterized protein LOC104817225 [Tarenaya hassleriana]|uniref:uncharacterized protein LOC104817225 n=1 Tax=Tarenaya hassleriana TaxID=28532 RepID=UPI00053C4525|nr:PREDICTED: uncharacterized protein LOC104817225 [Tarenaya hassleriana]